MKVVEAELAVRVEQIFCMFFRAVEVGLERTCARIADGYDFGCEVDGCLVVGLFYVWTVRSNRAVYLHME